MLLSASLFTAPSMTAISVPGGTVVRTSDAVSGPRRRFTGLVAVIVTACVITVGVATNGVGVAGVLVVAVGTGTNVAVLATVGVLITASASAGVVARGARVTVGLAFE